MINLFSPANRETRRGPSLWGQLWQKHQQALLRLAVKAEDNPIPLCDHKPTTEVWLCAVESEPLLRCFNCAERHIEMDCFYAVDTCLNCGDKAGEMALIGDEPFARYVWRAPGARYEIGVTCSWVCLKCRDRR